MMKELIEKLADLGYEGEYKEIEKNGTKLKGIVITGSSKVVVIGENGNKEEPSIHPVIYVDDILKQTDNDLDKAAKIIADIAEKSLSSMPLYDATKITSKEFILEHVKPVLMKFPKKNAIVKPSIFDKIYIQYEIIFKQGNEYASVTLNPEVLENAGLTEEEIEIAANNNNKEYTLSALGDVLGMNKEDIPTLYVVTNDGKYKGACGILNYKEILNKLGWKKAFMLPSSIHETLIIKADPFMNKQDLDFMVKEVNATELDPQDILGDESYEIFA